MIALGGDDISRGQVNKGVMSGVAMSAYLPLHLSPTDRCSSLEPWLRQWLGKHAKVLDPMDWFERGHDIVDWVRGSDSFW
jgi:hypothetical protein